jgi:PAS domain S-box-containing protein
MSERHPFEQMADSLDVAMVLVGADRKVSYGNAAAHQLLGLPSGQLVGSGAERLVAPERRGELQNLDDVLQGGAARKVRTLLRRPDGERFSATLIIEPYHDEGGGLAAVSVRYEAVGAARPSRPSQTPRSGAESGRPRPLSSPGELATGWFRPSGRPSERRLSPTSVLGSAKHRLERVLINLQRLEQRLAEPSAVAPLDEPSERARAMLHVSEARTLIETTLEELQDVGDAPLPGAPNVPKGC